ncbi:MAG: rod-binding protein [Planctomycetota bacterium]
MQIETAGLFGSLTHQPPQDPLLADQRRFEEVLSGRSTTLAGTANAARSEMGTEEEQARQAAEQMVALTFVQPILAQMRESSDPAGPFKPSAAEKQFRSMHDRLIAGDLVKAANFPIVEQLTQDLMKTGGLTAQQEGGDA